MIHQLRICSATLHHAIKVFNIETIVSCLLESIDNVEASWSSSLSSKIKLLIKSIHEPCHARENYYKHQVHRSKQENKSTKLFN